MSPSIARSPAKTDYYAVLGISIDAEFTPDSLKTAYRRALLLHHPDKVAAQRAADKPREAPKEHHTVDEIAAAYETLSEPAARSAYNEALVKNKARLATVGRPRNRAGLEAFDLEDLEFNDSLQKWLKECRCGGTYSVSEQELEEAASEGEVIASCHGCSLCVRITFDAITEEDTVT